EVGVISPSAAFSAPLKGIANQGLCCVPKENQNVTTKRPDDDPLSGFERWTVCNSAICAAASGNNGAAAHSHSTATETEEARPFNWLLPFEAGAAMCGGCSSRGRAEDS